MHIVTQELAGSVNKSIQQSICVLFNCTPVVKRSDGGGDVAGAVVLIQSGAIVYEFQTDIVSDM